MQKALSLLFCLMCAVCSWAITVKGVVTDEAGEPIIGATVVEVGNATNGTATDIDGAFAINVQPNASLQVSYVGYVTKIVKVAGQTRIAVTLQENAQALDEVVVVAFGKMKKEAFTGSAGVMKADDLIKAQVTNAAQALAGRVAGVQLNNSSSQMGESPILTIRGLGSISSKTEPLIVVDGMPYDGNISLINPQDIESMTVLKDAASNALYGARGANGVVMITTKKGSGSAKVTFDAKWGANTNAMTKYQTMNAQQFYETFYKSLYNYYITDKYAETAKLPAALTPTEAHQLVNKNLMNTSASNIGPGYMVYTVPNGEDFILPGGMMNPKATMGATWNYQGKEYWLQPDDWEKEGLRTGFRQEYNASVSGGSNGLNFYGSFGYLDNNGIQPGSDEKRITARAKIDYQAKKWLKVGGNFNFTNYKYNQISEGVVGNASGSVQHSIGIGTLWSSIKNRAPIYPVYLRGADKQIMIDQWNQPMYDFANGEQGLHRGGSSAIGGNAIFSNKYRSDEYDGHSYTVSGYADFQILPELTLTINGSSYTYDRKRTYINSPFVDYYTSSNDNGYLLLYKYTTKTYNTQQLLNYAKTFDKHDVGVLLGHEYYNYAYNYITGSGKNFGIEPTTEFGTCLTRNLVNSYSSDYNNEGYFGRVLYNYDHRYYANASFRRDASSRFDKDHRWGSFWSVGAAWVASHEEFFNVDWVDMLKLKFSVGSQGNDNIGNYRYADAYNIVNNDDEVAFQWKQKGTKNITWETNTNWNVGVEFDVLHNRLSGSIDYFYRKTSDMLFSLKTAPEGGYTSQFANLGDMRNAGFEIALDGTIMQTRDFRWTANFNIGYVKNKVLSLPDMAKTTSVEGHPGYVNADGAYVSLYNYYVGEGLPLYTWYVYHTAGLSEDGAQLYYKDVVKDGKPTGERTTTENASEATYYLSGDAMSPWNGGFGTTLNYKGFDLSINLNFQLGGLVYDYTYQGLMGTGSTATAQNWHKDMFKAWTPENKGTDVPRLRAYEKYSQNARSDRFLTNASYLNLQNINFGYTLPRNMTQRWGIERMRVFFSGENMGYVSARRGLDPRMSNIGLTNPEMYSPMRTLSGGIQLAF